MDMIIARLLDWVVYLELVAAICATVFYYKYKATALKWLLPYLWLVFGIEFLASQGTARAFMMDNRWIYNIQSVTEYTLIFYVYYRLLQDPLQKKTIIIFSAIFFLMLILGFLVFHRSFIELNTSAFSIGSVMVIYLVIAYFQEVLRSDTVLRLRSNLMIWVSIGWLFYHAGSLPLNLMANDIGIFSEAYYLRPIILVANLVLYTCLILGFLWSNKMSASSS